MTRPEDHDRTRLQQTLGHPDLVWLLERARRRLAQGRPATGLVSLQTPSPAQREALDRLLGRAPSSGGSLSVRLERLDALLRHAEICDGLAAAVELLCGPVRDQRVQAAQLAARWQELADTTRKRLAGRQALRDWLDELLTSGLLRRLSHGDPAQAQHLLDRCLALLERIPAPGIAIAELAAQVCGDSHGLDPGQPMATIAVRAAAALTGITEWQGSEARREVWARVGVLCDELSGPALVLGLTAADGGLTGRALNLHAAAGEPYRVTARQLLRQPPVLAPVVRGRLVFVCENPTVVAAAANRLGKACAPLLCTDGQPRTPIRLLLDLLVAAGAELRYHGDFDWPGLRIANLLRRRFSVQPWRMWAADYLAASRGPALAGSPVEADWDATLATAMQQRGAAVHEEQVLDQLLADLQTTGGC